jgi:futalosine hydrolase
MVAKHEICSMQVLVIAATANEIQPFISANTKADVLLCGVGVPSTIYHLQKRILQVEYDLVIQAGIAGAFDPNLKLAKVVFVKKDCFADLGFEEKQAYTPVFETLLADKNEEPFLDGWLVNDHPLLGVSRIEVLNAITVNKISDSKLQTQQYTGQFNADIESMEGAALHYVCLQEQIPFLQLRAISNYVGERDKSKWKMKEAIENLNTELVTLINGLTN